MRIQDLIQKENLKRTQTLRVKSTLFKWTTGKQNIKTMKGVLYSMKRGPNPSAT